MIRRLLFVLVLSLSLVVCARAETDGVPETPGAGEAIITATKVLVDAAKHALKVLEDTYHYEGIDLLWWTRHQ